MIREHLSTSDAVKSWVMLAPGDLVKMQDEQLKVMCGFDDICDRSIASSGCFIKPAPVAQLASLVMRPHT